VHWENKKYPLVIAYTGGKEKSSHFWVQGQVASQKMGSFAVDLIEGE
jgi:hypothetical protein